FEVARAASTSSRPSAMSADDVLPSIDVIYRGVIENITEYGAFCSLEGFRKQGLVHISQLSMDKVDKVEDVVSKGDKVFVKVVEIKETERGAKVSLSLKYASQGDGRDRDPNGSLFADEQQRRRPRIQKQDKIELGATYNTNCSK
ncbi:unnamed protein product, partial [Heterosigma akashiwo]